MNGWIASVDIRHEAAPLLSRGGRARSNTRQGLIGNRAMSEPRLGAFRAKRVWQGIPEGDAAVLRQGVQLPDFRQL